METPIKKRDLAIVVGPVSDQLGNKNFVFLHFSK